SWTARARSSRRRAARSPRWPTRCGTPSCRCSHRADPPSRGHPRRRRSGRVPIVWALSPTLARMTSVPVRLFTSESVTEGHPDKICDQISDAILDKMLEQDRAARVAVETVVTTGLVHVVGEVTTEAYVEIP